jgi:hypothetical protein
MSRAVCVLLGVLTFGVAIAQEVPNIDDAYAADREAALGRLGPAEDPLAILDAFAAVLRRCNRLDYEVELSFAALPGERPTSLEGSVAIGRGPGGALDRFRIDLSGVVPGAGSVDATLGSTGRGLYLIDRSRNSVVEFEAPGLPAPFDDLVRFALISSLEPSGSPVVDQRPANDAAEITLHFVDDASGEHVYGVFDGRDALPRLIERVTLGADDHPEIVSTRISAMRIDAAEPEVSFELRAPEGFERSGSADSGDRE